MFSHLTDLRKTFLMGFLGILRDILRDIFRDIFRGIFRDILRILGLLFEIIIIGELMAIFKDF